MCVRVEHPHHFLLDDVLDLDWQLLIDLLLQSLLILLIFCGNKLLVKIDPIGNLIDGVLHHDTLHNLTQSSSSLCPILRAWVACTVGELGNLFEVCILQFTFFSWNVETHIIRNVLFSENYLGNQAAERAIHCWRYLVNGAA